MTLEVMVLLHISNFGLFQQKLLNYLVLNKMKCLKPQIGINYLKSLKYQSGKIKKNLFSFIDSQML